MRGIELLQEFLVLFLCKLVLSIEFLYLVFTFLKLTVESTTQLPFIYKFGFKLCFGGRQHYIERIWGIVILSGELVLVQYHISFLEHTLQIELLIGKSYFECSILAAADFICILYLYQCTWYSFSGNIGSIFVNIPTRLYKTFLHLRVNTCLQYGQNRNKCQKSLYHHWPIIDSTRSIFSRNISNVGCPLGRNSFIIVYALLRYSDALE